MPTMAPNEMEDFGAKLEKFSASLNDNERSLFKQMFLIDRNRLSDKALDQVTGGGSPLAITFHGFNVEHVAPSLNASFFKMLCW
jgi:hypothetical protein